MSNLRSIRPASSSAGMYSRHHVLLCLFYFTCVAKINIQSLRCQQEDPVGETPIILSSNKRPQLLKGFCSMYSGVVGKAAKVGRNNTNGKTLFESLSWKKMGRRRTDISNYLGSVGPCRTVMQTKWGNVPIRRKFGQHEARS